MIRKLFYVLTFCMFILGKAQTPEPLKRKFFSNSLLFESQPELAKKQCDSLIKIANADGFYTLSSLCINKLAFMKMREGNYQESMKLLKQGIDVGEQSDDKSGVAVNEGFIGMQYLMMEMPKEGEKKIRYAINLLEDNKDTEFKPLVLGALYSILASIETNSLEDRKKFNNKGIENYEKLPAYSNKNSNLSQSYINAAMLSISEKNYEAAEKFLKKSDKYNKGRIEYFIATNHARMAEIKLQQKKYDSATYYGEKALQFLKDTDDLEELLLLNKVMKEATAKLGDSIKNKHYTSEYNAIQNKMYDVQLKTAGKTLEGSLEKENKMQKLGYISLGIALLLISSLFTLNVYNKKKYQKEIEAFKKLRETPTEQDVHKSSLNYINVEDAINENTEQELLKGLENFEAKQEYNQKGITLGQLATQLNTNVKYLSVVIKKHKAENFNNYINKMRIQNIISELEQNEQYQKYKISYLSEISGYSSPAAFTRAFSEITKVSPSNYIKFLKEEKNEQSNNTSKV